ncbi:MAG: serine protease [Paraburkholderia sp.]|nr:serine protease [Paraburkholderia sp.]
MPYAKRVSAAALLAVLPIFFCPAAGSANAAENETAPPAVVERPRVDQFIVKLRKPRTADVAAEAARPYRASSFDVSTLVLQRVVERVLRDERRAPQGAGAGVRTRRAANALGYTRAISGAAHVVGLAAPVDAVDAAALAKRLQAQPEVEYAEPDYRLRAHMEPTDPLYQQQWSYHETEAGANLSAAWDVTTGSANVVTAVLDSGYRVHSDLAANLLPGYDFVSDPFSANDGDGRDSDASDPGNWATLEDSLQCDGTIGWVTNSTWHGTHVAGTIGAVANNGVGGVGVAWQGRIVPVRVLGKCGGVVSDIIDAMRWAAGLPVPGVPGNPYPAKVINLSLGMSQPCTSAMQEAIDDVLRQGTSVVASAGNSDGGVSMPANCHGAIAIAAVDRKGGKAPFSNFGPRVDIGAPGVEIVSTANAGKTTPAEDNYMSYSGTSMAAPHVTGTIALMLAANPALTPDAIRAKLISSVRRYPAGSSCAEAVTGSVCGPGMLDAQRAVQVLRSVAD